MTHTLTKPKYIVIKALHISRAASAVTRSEVQYDFLAVDTNIHLQNNYNTKNFHHFRREDNASKEKKYFCLYYGQSNYPKVIFKRNVGAIKEHLRKFELFRKPLALSDARRFACNHYPRGK